MTRAFPSLWQFDHCKPFWYTCDLCPLLCLFVLDAIFIIISDITKRFSWITLSRYDYIWLLVLFNNQHTSTVFVFFLYNFIIYLYEIDSQVHWSHGELKNKVIIVWGCIFCVILYLFYNLYHLVYILCIRFFFDSYTLYFH